MTKSLLVVLYLFMGGVFCVSVSGLCAEEVPPPNIVMVLADDMGVMDSSVPFLTDKNGKPKSYPRNRYFRTPSMERLAGLGIRFSTFYANSSCSPSRVSLMNGQTCARHRVTTWILPDQRNRVEFGPPDWNWEGINKDMVTLPALLQDKGYFTIHVGKGHTGPHGSFGADPRNYGFDVNIAGQASAITETHLGTKNFGVGKPIFVPYSVDGSGGPRSFSSSLAS